MLPLPAHYALEQALPDLCVERLRDNPGAIARMRLHEWSPGVKISGTQRVKL
jgi:hypothetical protein